MIDNRLLKPYNPSETEDRIYKTWEESGLFNPDICVKKGATAKDAKAFSMVLPPPNVTGMLHMGHSAMIAIEDILTRYHRMKGYKTLWLPGTDHAAIATQSKVADIIYKEEKKTRHDLGREEFLRRVEDYAQKSHDTIVHQIKKLGASVDWSREAYTLDEKRNLAVRTAFKKMYDDGLIYRGYRVINWDPKGQTTVSDDEVEYKETKGILYTFRYSSDFPVPIATTRPETKLGDTAVAVHPDDARYREYIGKEYDVDFIGVKLHIKVIADDAVDPSFGTGAVGVTPAHSMIDFEIGKRHNLPLIQVINEYGKLMIEEPELSGKKVLEARKIIVERLKSRNLITEEKEITQRISTAQRSGGIIEPLPKLQWFIDVNKKFTLKKSRIKGISNGDQVTLKEIMRKVVENGQITIIPDYLSKTYFHWIDNLGDWCVSRQIWYGHRIPVWYNPQGEIYCGIEPPTHNWQGEGWTQDPDTLDTWFSSGLWTFSTLGWPENTRDLEIYHPTTVLETGYDILFFWVARMILMTGYLLGDIPFHTVYLHGLVRDKSGRKMSKSLGNIIDPLDMIKKYGADATRMSLIIGSTPGTDINLAEDKIKGYKHFANKIWNATRFVLSNTEGVTLEEKPSISPRDREILGELNNIVREVTEDIEGYRLYLAGEKLYHYFWHTFADIIIEESKKRIVEGGDEARSCKWMLLRVLTTMVRMLHPFMPFVTEEIWSMIPGNHNRLLIIESWPSWT
jgi:valyl-tRNA synthetase